jgi:hypothetical protein
MELSTIGAALQILDRAWKALEAVRERVQASKDAALKEGVGKLYDEFNALRSAITRLKEENASLRQAQIEKPQKPEIRQVGQANYYFVGDDGPYCQPCYDRDKKLIRLTPAQEVAGGFGRKCLVCLLPFVEKTTPAPRMALQRRPYTRR